MSNLYVSALHLDRKAVKALRISDPYSLHRVVYSLFSDKRSEDEKQSHVPSGIAYADQGGDVRGRKVLILSDREPALRVDGEFGEVICRPIADSFLQHSRYRFTVQINPVRKDAQTGKRVPVRGHKEITEWFSQRAKTSWGFEVQPETLDISKIEVLQFHGKSQNKITFGKAHIKGVLTVCNHNTFVDSFKKGIGKGRAFGCGLLQIVPIDDNPFA